jgi:cation transport ATPase
LGESGVVDKASGDAVRAGAFVQDGALTVRVEDAGGRSAATHVDSLLPRGPFPDLPASREAERIAERNVKPTLALAALSLFFTRTLQPAQGVIRPDYATGPRISAQLSTLRSVADGWRQGVLFRDLGALERLAAARVYVFDDSAGLERGALEVAQIDTSDGISAGLARGYALVAAEALPAEQSLALRAYASQRELTQPNGTSVQRFAGGIRYRSPRGKTVEIARTSYVLSSNAKIPDRFREALHEHGARPRRGRGTEVSRRDLSLDPLWVLRNGVVIGAISFARNGEPLARNLVAALRAQNRRARIIHVSRRGRTEANALARKLDIELVHAGLSHAGKQALVRSLGGGTLWVGDGSDPHVREAMLASSVSLSVAPSWKTLSDKADVLLPHEGLAGVTTAIAIARAHAARLAGDYRLVYAANLLGVAGALLTGLSPLRIGLLSNLGTGVVFARHARALERAAAAAEQEHGRLRSLPGR